MAFREVGVHEIEAQLSDELLNAGVDRSGRTGQAGVGTGGRCWRPITRG